MKLRVLIVDDEHLARERLKLMLADEGDIEIAGECSDGDEALERISSTALDLLFLDIQMPESAGWMWPGKSARSTCLRLSF